jgi:hypothetical protein
MNASRFCGINWTWLGTTLTIGVLLRIVTLCFRRVLHLGELSRKMETMLEQILPFGAIDAVPQVAPADGHNSSGGNTESMGGAASVASSHAAPQSSNASGPHISRKGKNAEEKPGIYVPPPHQSSVWNVESNPVPSSDRLANFYKKYNRVLLDNIAIEKERSRLATENAQLEDLLQQYLDGTRLTDDTLSEDNPLFVVNGRYLFDSLLCICIFIRLLSLFRANLNAALPVKKITTIQDATYIQSVVARQGGR